MNRLGIEATKFFVNTAGRLSTGLELCRKEGLTAGITLEYVYRNKPSGKTAIGKAIDAAFLSNIGWEGIRTRKRNLVGLLVKALDRITEEHLNPFVLDVASGPALYIVDALNERPGITDDVLCRDLDERWFEKGRKNAKEKGVDGIRFEKGDALNRDSFIDLPYAPHICVSSGFYDWIAEDKFVKKSINIIYDILEPGGYFVFTNQSGHPDMRLVSEVFCDFNNEALNMKTRPKNTVNKWAEEAGFEILESVQDEWGFYTVTLARKK